MTDYQNELVMEHLDLVNWVIRTRISVPNRPLLTYDDFYAIGCEAICRAALKYQADSGEFAPFACRYIYNAIIDHCRAMNYRLQRSVDAGFEEGEVLFDLLAHTTVDFEAEVTDDSAMAALRACKEKYQGVARKGVEAIELKLQGYESVEIADLYPRPTPYAARPVVPAGPTQEELDAEYIRICQSYDPTSEEWTVDRYNRRWIMCTVCGRIKQDVQMSYYGGKGGANRGVCADCSRNGRS